MKIVRETPKPEPSARTEFLARSDVSKILGVSPNTVTRWAREGRLPCHVTLGGHHRFERELVEQLRRDLYRASNSSSFTPVSRTPQED